MNTSYTAVKNFIQQEILDAGAEINRLDITRSAIKSITGKFSTLGWSVENTAREGESFSRHLITSPDGLETLKMTGGKVFRHPMATEVICRQKLLTKQLMSLAHIPHPVGISFSSSERAIATAIFPSIPKPVVVKPSNEGASRGVTIGVTSPEEFSAAWNTATQSKHADTRVIIEELVDGVELRAFVVGEDVVSTVVRLQPFVVGDGQATVNELIGQLRQEREINSRARVAKNEIDHDFLRSQRESEQSVPEQGKIVLLNRFTLSSRGAFVVDITSKVAPGIVDMARRAKNAIPGLEIAGVDLLVGDIRDASTAKVVEVNTSAALDLHRYPTHGPARNVDDDIVQHFHNDFLEQARISSEQRRLISREDD